MGEKVVTEAYLLAASPLGLLGGLHFYLNRPHFGVFYLCTVGVFGVGYLVDLVRVPMLVKEANMRALHKKDPTQPLPSDKSIIDAYITWFPLGLLGLHHLYLKRSSWAVLYAVTLGLFAVGWIIDAIWMVSLVNEANRRLTDPKEKERKQKKKLKEKSDSQITPSAIKDTTSIVVKMGMDTPRSSGTINRTESLVLEKRDKDLRSALALGLSPLGLFGAHHFYLRRNSWGILYAVSLGLLGTGWIRDWFRLVFLVRRANAIAKNEHDKKQKMLDDAYTLWFPLGLLGFHHFYLGRTTWGLLYMVTVGVFGIGWIMDAFRLPYLVEVANMRRIDDASHAKTDDVEPNITPAADDYNDNSVTLNLGNDEDDDEDENKTNNEKVKEDTGKGEEGKAEAETTTTKEKKGKKRK